MAFSRYARAPILALGGYYGTSDAVHNIRLAMANGNLRTEDIVLKGAERLDTIAGRVFGDGRYAWILAATSDIGWGLQVPAGTVIKIPKLEDIAAVVK